MVEGGGLVKTLPPIAALAFAVFASTFMQNASEPLSLPLLAFTRVEHSRPDLEFQTWPDPQPRNLPFKLFRMLYDTNRQHFRTAVGFGTLLTEIRETWSEVTAK